MGINGCSNVTNERLTAPIGDDDDEVPVVQSPKGHDNIRRALGDARKATEGGAHFIDVSTFTVGGQKAIIKRMSSASKTSVEAAIDERCSEVIGDVHSTLRSIFGADAQVFLVLDGAKRHELKRERVISRLVGTEKESLRRRESAAKKAAQREKGAAARRAARVSRGAPEEGDRSMDVDEGEAHDGLMDVDEGEAQDGSMDVDQGDAQAGVMAQGPTSQNNKQSWSPLDLKRADIRFPVDDNTKVVYAVHEADPEIARRIRSDDIKNEYQPSQVFIWSSDSDHQINSSSRDAGTIITSCSGDQITFIDRVALEASAPFRRLATEQARIFAGIFAGCDYEHGIPRHGLSSILQNNALIELCCRGWETGDEAIFAAELERALSSYTCRNAKTQSSVRSYTISLDTMLKIEALMSGKDMEEHELFQRSDLVPGAKDLARTEVENPTKRRQPSSDGAEETLVWPSAPHDRDPDFKKRKQQQRQLRRASGSSHGAHASPIGVQVGRTTSKILHDIAVPMVEWTTRLAEAASVVAPSQDSASGSTQTVHEEDPPVVGSKRKATAAEADAPSGDSPDVAGEDPAAADVISDAESDTDRMGATKGERQRKGMTLPHFQRPETTPAPKKAKDAFRFSTQSLAIDQAFRRISVPSPDGGRDGDEEMQPGSNESEDEAGEFEDEAGRATSGDEGERESPRSGAERRGSDGGQALRTALETALRQHAFEANVLVVALNETIEALLQKNIAHDWANRIATSTKQSEMCYLLTHMAELALFTQREKHFTWSKKWPPPPSAEQIEQGAFELELGGAGNIGSEEGVTFRSAWTAVREDLKLMLRRHKAIERQLAAQKVTFSALAGIASACEVVYEGFETSFRTTLRVTAQREMRLLLQHVSEDPEQHARDLIGDQDVVHRPRSLGTVISQFETGQRARRHRNKLVEAIFDALDEIAFSRDGTSDEAAQGIEEAVSKWIETGKGVPSRLAKSPLQSEFCQHIGRVFGPVVAHVMELVGRAAGAGSFKGSFGAMLRRQNKHGDIPAQQAGLVLRVLRRRRSKEAAALPGYKGTSLAFNMVSLHQLFKNWEDLASVCVTNVSCVIADTQQMLDLIPPKDKGDFRQYSNQHELLRRFRLFGIANSTGLSDSGSILLSGVHDLRIVHVLAPDASTSEAASVAIAEVELDSQRSAEVLALYKHLRLPSGIKHAAKASGAWFGLLLRNPFGARFVPNGTAVMTAASVSIHFRDLMYPTVPAEADGKLKRTLKR
ncbi:hypothetical protein JCM10908_003865 [Rhodotorula pacifica]|uniref:uncharacterized protein n=1 Tax=Rhodotorula pacifica TaxID=1495444 RepID=UPI003172DA04